MLRWLVLDLNSFFASCEQQENPALRGLPVIVVPTLADTTSAIAASYPAKALGITTGTKVYDAKRICPGIKIVLASHKTYLHYHQKIIEAIETEMPVEDVMSIDEVACRLDKTQQTIEAATALANRIKQKIHSRVGACLTSSVGISANKLLAKLASNMQKPDGLVVLPPENLPGAISHLSLRDIPGIGPSMEARLHNAGIHCIEELWAATAPHMRMIWNGVVGAKMHGLLHGEDIITPKHTRSSISHQHVLAPNDRNKANALPIMRQLLIKAAQRIRTDNYFCAGLSVDIKFQSREHGYWYDKTRFQETQDTAFLLNALAGLWEKVPGYRPIRIGIALGGLRAAAEHQPDLFDKPRDNKLAHVLDTINTKFGRGTLSYGNAMAQLTTKIAFQRVPKLSEYE